MCLQELEKNKLDDQDLNRLVFDIIASVVKALERAHYSENTIQRNIDRQFALKLVKQVGPTALVLLYPVWKLLLSTDQLVTLLCDMRETIHDISDAKVEETAEKLVLECLSSECYHGKEAGSLASYFKFGSGEYIQARTVVLVQSKWYHHMALLSWAEYEYDNVGRMTNGVLQLVTKAVEVMDDMPSRVYKTDNETLVPDVDTVCKFEWILKKTLGEEEKPKKTSQEFKTFIQALMDHCKTFPHFLLHVICNVENIPALKKSTMPLRKHLVVNYYRFYDHWLCGCIKYCYVTLIESMKAAADTCAKYLTNGRKLFIEQVARELKQKHAQKRKFCAMLDETFGIQSKFSK